jgi:exonuclease SbcD
MRLLHISDWHLGRVTYACPRSPDHDRVIGEITDIAKDFRPHLICHTGDVFDAVRPSYPDLARGVDALQTLAAIAPVLVVCGNHDSPALFRLFATLLGKTSRIHFIDSARPPEHGGVLEFQGEKAEIIRIAPLPFVHGNRFVDAFEDPSTWMTLYADRIQKIEDALDRGLTDGFDPSRHILVFAAHLHVTGAVFSGSERALHVTDTYASRLERIPHVSYAAFGHIHRPQPLPGAASGWYAGSPIPLDFGEKDEKKLVVTVEAEPSRPAVIQTHELSGGRPLRRLTGTLEELQLLAPTVGDALCAVTVCTRQPLPDLDGRIRELFPAATLLSVYEDCEARQLSVLGARDGGSASEPSFSEMFREYLAVEGTRGAEADSVMRTFDGLIRAVEQDDEAPFPEVESLERTLEESVP